MQIRFCGAAQTVTGSMHLIEVNGSKLLLECGLFQGPRQESFERNRTFPFDPTTIDAVILSHAHIDHSGNLPHLVKHGFNGPIYATPATADLGNIMLLDSGHIQERQAESMSYYNRKRGLPGVDPLYTQEEAAEVLPLFRPVSYEVPFEAINGVRARFVDAGHILGSAAVDLELEEKGRKVHLWFSGDIGRRDLPILRDPVLPEKVDILLMESTYGDKPHRGPELAYLEMREVILRTLDRGGKVIIPAFAVGRTQELVYNLNRMHEAGELPNVPIYVDSPLAVNTTAVFRSHPECYDAEARAFLRDELQPLAELGRPRIDVVMTLSGIFRDLLPLQTRMLAEAAFLAASADEPEHPCAGEKGTLGRQGLCSPARIEDRRYSSAPHRLRHRGVDRMQQSPVRLHRAPQ